VEFDEFIVSLTAALGLRAAALPPLTVVLFDDAARTAPDCCAHAEGERVIGLVAGGNDQTLRRASFHAGVHWITSADPAPRPRWFDEGVAEVFSTFGIRGRKVHWGDPIAVHTARLRSDGLMPMREFLESDAAGGRYAAQSWALAHLLLLGGESGQGRSLREHLAAYRDDRGDADFAGMERALGEYFDGPPLARGLHPRGLVERKYVIREANPTAVAHALARIAPDCALRAAAVP
jgi:hypothetical protein